MLLAFLLQREVLSVQKTPKGKLLQALKFGAYSTAPIASVCHKFHSKSVYLHPICAGKVHKGHQVESQITFP